MKRGNVRFEERTFCDDEIVIEDQPRQLLFIGVMTAQKFLDTRFVISDASSEILIRNYSERYRCTKHGDKK